MTTLEKQTRRTLRSTVLWPALVSLLLLAGLSVVSSDLLHSIDSLRDMSKQRRGLLNLEKEILDAETNLRMFQLTGEPEAQTQLRQDMPVIRDLIAEQIDSSASVARRALLNEIRSELNTWEASAVSSIQKGSQTFLASRNIILDAIKNKIDLIEKGDKERLTTLADSIEEHSSVVVLLLVILSLSFVVGLPLFTGSRVQALSQEFQRLIEKTKEASRAKSSFLANMSHEIRSPISAILGYSEIMDARLKDPDDRSALRVISSNANHLLDLVNDVLDFSKIESLSMKIKEAPVVLETFVAEIVSMNAARAALQNITLETLTHTELPEVIFGDQLRLRQVVLNLLSNAIKFSDAGDRISLELESFSRDSKGILKISVQDQGPGIKKENQEKLFDAFTQIDQDDQRIFQGTGLGLAISKRLILLMGGEIGLESELGKGSRFWVELPCFDPETARFSSATDHKASSRSSNSRIPSLSGKCGLVVDDRTDIRLMIQQFFFEAGAEVVAARDGFDVVNQLNKESRHIDFVVLDIQMPGKDGFKVLEELRATGITAPVVALTASASTAVKERCLAAGFDAFLAKPVQKSRVVETIHRLLNTPSAPPVSNSHPTTVFVIDDQPTVTQLLRMIFQHRPDVKLHVASTLEETRHKLCGADAPDVDVAVVDARLSQAESGAEAVRLIRSLYPSVQIVGMSADEASELPQDFADMLDDFVTKTELTMLPYVVERAAKRHATSNTIKPI